MFRAIFVISMALSASMASPFYEETQLSESSKLFGFDIYQKVIEGVEGNVMISPASIQSAVSLAMFGATGQTKDEMMHGLKYPAEYSTNSIADDFKSFNDYVEQTNGLKIANKIFIKEGFSVKPAFQEVAKKSFYSEAQNLDFSNSIQAAKAINSWVEEQTDHLIKDLIKPDSLDQYTRMVLVNAIYFKGKWTFPFSKEDTFKSQFHLNDDKVVETDFMKISERFRYGEFRDLDATAVGLPYADSDITMMIVMPNKVNGLSELEHKFGPKLDEMLDGMYIRNVDLEMPKFKIEFETKLVKQLQKMGMNKMFTDSAEFNDMLSTSDSLKISDIVHKTFIEVDEEGTQAAAGTGAHASMSIMRYRQAAMKIDRPFLFVLRSPTTTLFVGRVVKF